MRSSGHLMFVRLMLQIVFPRRMDDRTRPQPCCPTATVLSSCASRPSIRATSSMGRAERASTALERNCSMMRSSNDAMCSPVLLRTKFISPRHAFGDERNSYDDFIPKTQSPWSRDNAESGPGRPHCPSEPPNHRASAHENRRVVCLEQTAAIPLIVTQPVHSHDGSEPTAALGHTRWTNAN